MFRCGLWASSGPFPLSARYGLYKRGRDPPTNPSRHLKKERSELSLKWLLKEDRRRRPTAASVAAARRCARRLFLLPSRTTYVTHRSKPPSPLPPQAAAVAAAASGRRRSGSLCRHDSPPAPSPSPLRLLLHFCGPVSLPRDSSPSSHNLLLSVPSSSYWTFSSSSAFPPPSSDNHLNSPSSLQKSPPLFQPTYPLTVALLSTTHGPTPARTWTGRHPGLTLLGASQGLRRRHSRQNSSCLH